MQATAQVSEKKALSSDPSSKWESIKALLPFLFVYAAACFTFFACLGDYPLFNPDEALYAEPAREMNETGEYITTYLNYVVRFTKPPLVIWAMAIAYKAFGTNEFAARFLGASCAALLVALTYLFVNRYSTKRAAFLASFSLITAPLFVGTAREAITDMPLGLFIGGAMMAFFHGFRQNKRSFAWLGYMLVGLAVMTKGPVGLILPVAILGAYHLLRAELVTAWRYYQPHWGLLIVTAIAAPWFALEIYVTKGAYFQEFLVRENFQRFTSVVDHKGAWWYHIAAVAGGFLPWSIFAPQSLWNAIKRGTQKDEDAVAFFSALTFLIILAFFSASVSKLLPYTIPGFPALAIVLGIYLDRQITDKKVKALSFPFVLLAIVCCGALYVVPKALVHLREMPPALPGIVEGGLISLCVITWVTAVGAYFNRANIAIPAFAVAVLGCFLTFGHQALDIVSNEWEGPIPTYSQFAALSGQPIIVYHMRKPSIPFYACRKVLNPLDETELRNVVDSNQRAYVIGKTADLALLSSLSGCRVVSQQGRFVLLQKQPAALD